MNTDEEIGSVDSGRFIRLLARGAERAFVLESGEGADGKLKIARKGLGPLHGSRVHGRPAHAGADFEHGVSAILELSLQVQRLFALNDPARGVTVNVGTIDGGLRPNVVAPSATRGRRRARPDRGGGTPRRACAQGAGAGARRAPRSRSRAASAGRRWSRFRATARCLPTAIRLGRELGLSIEDAGLVGGGSDANTTSLFTGHARRPRPDRRGLARDRRARRHHQAARAHSAPGPPPARAAR